jgi:hypothetical protein
VCLVWLLQQTASKYFHKEHQHNCPCDWSRPFCLTETKYFIRVKLISGSTGLTKLFERQPWLDAIDWLIRWKFHNILSLQKQYSMEWNCKMICNKGKYFKVAAIIILKVFSLNSRKRHRNMTKCLKLYSRYKLVEIQTRYYLQANLESQRSNQNSYRHNIMQHSSVYINFHLLPTFQNGDLCHCRPYLLYSASVTWAR